MPTLRDLGEREVIRRLAAANGAPGAGVTLGIGDDAALLTPAPGETLAVTTDAFVEGRHFLRGWASSREIGARLAAANLSDLAAMAARPRWALLSHGLRAEHDADDLVEFQSGAADALRREGAAIVGGNLARVEGAEWSSMTLLGGVAEGRAWTRAGARAGDRLAVTGHPGRAGAAARLAMKFGRMPEAEHPELVRAWRAPASRVALALALAEEGGVRAAMDLSDGLAGDLAALCEASGVGAALDTAALAADAVLEAAARKLGTEPAALATAASDDYELLLAVAPDRFEALAALAREHGAPFTAIGMFTAPGGAPGAAGFDHFRTAS